ncbi:MAG: amidohydrolase family protein [Pseudomonadota bacterium]
MAQVGIGGGHDVEGRMGGDGLHARVDARRRRLVGGGAALGALAIGGCAAIPDPGANLPGAGPARGEWLLRGGYVMTMERSVGDLAGADVHVRDGVIVAVGRALQAPGARVIDARDMIVMPGMVETHWHMWNTLLRSMSLDEKKFGYFPTALGLGRHYVPGDMYAGTRLACAEAIHSGITFVHDWCHNIRTPTHARENLRALSESGLRGRFSYGTMQGHPVDQTMDLADLERLRADWSQHDAGGRLALGIAWRGVATGGTGAIKAEASRRDIAEARRLGLPVSVHLNNSRARAGGIAQVAKDGLLGPDLQAIHAVWVTPEEVRALVDSRAAVSISPFTELRIGFGVPPTSTFLQAGIPLGLSVDTTALSGNADMFGIMKVTQNAENARTENEFQLPARRVLELATIEGARSMGMADRIGSLAAGKRADLIMVDTRAINLGVFTDPAHLLVEAAQPGNVDTVMVDGRLLKSGGRLTALDPARVVADARESLAALRKRANWW